MDTQAATDIDLRLIEAEVRRQVATTLGIDSRYVEFDAFEDDIDPTYFYATLDITVPLNPQQKAKLNRWLDEYGGQQIKAIDA